MILSINVGIDDLIVVCIIGLNEDTICLIN